jgi:hypothetical protein
MSGCAGIGLARATRNEEDCDECQGGVARHEDEERAVTAQEIEDPAVERIADSAAECIAEQEE